jgi:hypothetical protein
VLSIFLPFHRSFYIGYTTYPFFQYRYHNVCLWSRIKVKREQTCSEYDIKLGPSYWWNHSWRCASYPKIVLPLFQNKSCIWILIALQNKNYILVKFLSNFSKRTGMLPEQCKCCWDELPSQIATYICLTFDIWTWRRRCTSTWFYVFWCHLPK